MRHNRKILLGIFIIFLSGVANAQIIRTQYIAIQGGALDFSSRWLNNPYSYNKRISALSQIEYGYPLSKYISTYANVSLGHLKNMGTNFPSEIGSDFFRIGAGLLLNPNNGTFFLSENPKTIEPYGIVGYNFDVIGKNPQANLNRMISSVCFGVGCWIMIADRLCVGYRYTLNQKLGQDYRTFNQHTMGFLIGINSFIQEVKQTPIKLEHENTY